MQHECIVKDIKFSYLLPTVSPYPLFYQSPQIRGGATWSGGVFTASQLLFLLCPSKVKTKQHFISCLQLVLISLVMLIHLFCGLFYSCMRPKDLPGPKRDPATRKIFWQFPTVSLPILSQQCLQPTLYLCLLRPFLLWSALLTLPYWRS